jgi:hypothetical protein
MGKDAFERLGMADREPNVAAFDAGAEQTARRAIGDRNDAAVDDQRRFVERVDHRTFE